MLLSTDAGSSWWIALFIFLGSYAAIVSEKIHKTKVALTGGALMILFGILDQEEAFHSTRYGIDHNVVFLLIGMMIIISIMGFTGVFEWVAVKMAKAAKGDPLKIMVGFVLICCCGSAFLDNVTTVLLLAPVALLISEELEIDPVPQLIALAIASNIGGTATLIGDPPNIMIGSKADLGFAAFLVHMAPIVLVMVVALALSVWLFFRRRLVVTPEKRARILAMDESRLIKNKALALKSTIVLTLVVLGFSLHSVVHIEPATIALAGAAILLLISREDPEHVLKHIEWPTIFLFIGLFLVVGGVVKVGIVESMSQFVIKVTDPTPTDMQTTALTVLWFSGIASAVVDNIPYVATMIPLVMDMANSVFLNGAGDPAALPKDIVHHETILPVWWSLAFGACLGGNATPIGASANVVVLGIAAKAGHKVTFLRFMAYGVPVTIFTLALSTLYVWLRYYALA